MAWTLDDIPDLKGRTALVTGGNVGLGFRTALELARNGAAVVIACRDHAKGGAAAERIQAEAGGAKVDVVTVDLANLRSFQEWDGRIGARVGKLDILVNNAGVVNLRTLSRTDDGHEMHMAVNHYGHFALTGCLFPLLAATPGARVVTLTSAAWRSGHIDFSDLDWTVRPYSRGRAYGDSKLANLLFMRALQARFDRLGIDALSVAAHPGLTGTERQQSVGVGGLAARLIASPVDRGVRPQLRAATDPSATARAVYGPAFGLRGPARQVKVSGHAVDDELAEALWEVTEAITGVRYPETLQNRPSEVSRNAGAATRERKGTGHER